MSEPNNFHQLVEQILEKLEAGLENNLQTALSTSDQSFLRNQEDGFKRAIQILKGHRESATTIKELQKSQKFLHVIIELVRKHSQVDVEESSKDLEKIFMQLNNHLHKAIQAELVQAKKEKKLPLAA